MNKIKTSKILIPVDFSKTSLNAIKYAAFMAKYTKGELVLVHVQSTSDLLEVIMPAVKLKNISVITDFLYERLEKIAADIRKRYGIMVSSFISTGHVTSEIINMAEETKSTLMVMGTHGKDSDNGFFLGSNAYRVLTKSDIPVMTVQTAADKLGFQNILVPIDTSDHSRQKVDSAIFMADKFASKLHILGILHTGNKGEQNYKYKMEVIMGQIKKMADKKKISCTTDIQFADNRATTTLEYAKKVKADLILSMTDQNAEFSSVVLGNYIHQLTNESKIPVLCIPPELRPDMLNGAIGGLEY
jgi:nucleotide-binding universal stress UspA family protein